MPRALGGVPLALIQANDVDFAWFVRIEIPTGTIVRYTTHAGGDFDDFTGDIDGDAALWSSYDVKIGTLVQNQGSPLDVSYIDLQNLDYIWTAKILNDGIRFRSVQIYQAWFYRTSGTDTIGKPYEPGDIAGKFLAFDGRTDEAQISGNRVKISLNPHRTPWTTEVPARRFLPTCQYLFRDALTCQYVGADASCVRTITDCTSKGNQAHFGGFNLMPPATLKITFGGDTVSLGPAPSAPPETPITPPASGPPPPPVTPPEGGGPPVVPFR